MPSATLGRTADFWAADPPASIVVLPSKRDFTTWLIVTFGPAARTGFSTIGGSYIHEKKELVSQDLGSTLRHEFFHVLHWRSMIRLAQDHPIWIQEGLYDNDYVRTHTVGFDAWKAYLLGEEDGIAKTPEWQEQETGVRIVAENLAENAIRYSGHGAKFTFDVSRARDFVVLTASDDGVGVPPAALERLFERFFRADAARTTRGTGLGLAIVKHIVVAAGGDIDADGGPGRGLRIRATFPA